MTVSDFPDWQAPQAHASAIASTGVPLLSSPAVVYDSSHTSAPSGTPVPLGNQPIDQIGYTISANVAYPTTPTVPFVIVNVQWIDSVLGLEVASDTFTVPGAVTPGFIATVCTGTTKADIVNVVLTNIDPAVTANVSLFMVQDSYVRMRDNMHVNLVGLASSAVPGSTLAITPQDESVLGFLDDVTVPASGTTSFLFGAYNGLVNVGYEVNTGSSANLGIRIRPKPDSAYSGHNIIFSAVNPPSNFQIAASRAMLGLVLANSATTDMAVSLSMIAAE